jgi:hypothetical protein
MPRGLPTSSPWCGQHHPGAVPASPRIRTYVTVGKPVFSTVQGSMPTEQPASKPASGIR